MAPLITLPVARGVATRAGPPITLLFPSRPGALAARVRVAPPIEEAPPTPWVGPVGVTVAQKVAGQARPERATSDDGASR